MKKFYIIFGIVCVILLTVLFSMKDTTSSPTSMDELPQTSGLHIMADGTVMDGSGQPLENATIQSDGNIRMPDGKVYIPMADFR